ncbi:MAG TPA: dienelactone hydrolase family protein, partial [Anaerolineaceae bacterium]
SAVLEGNLTLPPEARGAVLFVHGSGSSRMSPRNRYVAQVLNRGNLGRLLFDLLTAEEEAVDMHTRELRFDVDFLARRVIGSIDWLLGHPAAAGLSIGLFGASTGAAAALVAAAYRPDVIGAVVSRGGRPELAGGTFEQVRAPTLLIVGGLDMQVIALNEQAYEQLYAERRLEIVAGATHLFEEPGALEEVAQLARKWFRKFL